MLPVIITKRHKETKTKRDRVEARCENKIVSRNWDYGISEEQNHEWAALDLAGKLLYPDLPYEQCVEVEGRQLDKQRRVYFATITEQR